MRSFQKYVPVDLVRTLLRSGQEARLGAVTYRITTSFADVSNFTAITERMDPTALIDSLADYLGMMDRIVWEHGGTVDKYIGDAVMALWGPPIRPLPDHAAAACEAALAFGERFELLRTEREAESRTSFEVLIGIHTGDALVGNIGSEHRINYTAMGDSVNLASRLEGLNRAYGTSILISEITYDDVKEQFETRLIDRVAVKGRRQPVNVYELLSRRGDLSEERSRIRVAYAEGLRLYQNRQWEAAIQQFEDALTVGTDAPSRTLLERCRSYLEAPPPDDWNGVYVRTIK